MIAYIGWVIWFLMVVWLTCTVIWQLFDGIKNNGDRVN